MDLVSIFHVGFMVVAALAPIAVYRLPELPVPPEIITAIVVGIAVAIVGSIGAIKTRRSEQAQERSEQAQEETTLGLQEEKQARRHLQATTDNLVREVARLARGLEAFRAAHLSGQPEARQDLDALIVSAKTTIRSANPTVRANATLEPLDAPPAGG